MAGAAAGSGRKREAEMVGSAARRVARAVALLRVDQCSARAGGFK